MWQTKYSAKELLHALLTSETARDDVKFSLLKKMGRDIHYVGQELNEEYKEYARKHNDVVRIKLRDFFEKTDIRDLMDR
ncbi:hypothetical protein KKH82_03955 [Patescibacteria group bacterium]|nr:hypothetical protein [Patescibacteria group bacterium]